MSFIGTAIRGALAYVGVRALYNFSKSAIEVASNLVEVQNVVDVTFGSMADSVNTFADNAIESFGLSELSAKKYTAYLGAMLKSSGITGEAIKDMSLSLTEHVADMASFYNLPYDEMFDKIMGGMAGAVKPLRVLGVNMTIANMESYALAQGITKSWKAMSQAEKTMLRYNYLMNATNDSSGDFVRTQHTWANQVKILQEKWKAFSAELGQGLINVLIHVVRGLNNVIEGLITAARYFREFTALVFGSADVKSKGAVIDLGDTESDLGDIEEQADKTKKALMGFDEINQLDILPDEDAGNEFPEIPTVETGAPISIDVDVSSIETKFGKLKEIFNTLFDPIKTAWDNFVINTTPKMETWAMETWQSIKTSFSNLESVWDTISESWLKSLDKYKPKITKNLEDTLTNIQQSFTTAGTILTGMWETWTGDLKVFTDTNKTEIGEFTDNIVLAFSRGWTLLNVAWEIALLIIETTWNEVGKPLFTVVGNWITGIFGGLITFINGVFAGDWEKALEGVVKIFGTVFNGIVELMRVPVNLVIGVINGLLSQINSLMQSKIGQWALGKLGLDTNFKIELIEEIGKPYIGPQKRGKREEQPTPFAPPAPPKTSEWDNFFSNWNNVPPIPAIPTPPKQNTTLDSISGLNGTQNYLDLVEPIASAVGTSVMSAMQFVTSDERKGTAEVSINIDGNKLAKVMLPKINRETERLGLKSILQTS